MAAHGGRRTCQAWRSSMCGQRGGGQPLVVGPPGTAPDAGPRSPSSLPTPSSHRTRALCRRHDRPRRPGPSADSGRTGLRRAPPGCCSAPPCAPSCLGVVHARGLSSKRQTPQPRRPQWRGHPRVDFGCAHAARRCVLTRALFMGRLGARVCCLLAARCGGRGRRDNSLRQPCAVRRITMAPWRPPAGDAHRTCACPDDGSRGTPRGMPWPWGGVSRLRCCACPGRRKSGCGGGATSSRGSADARRSRLIRVAMIGFAPHLPCVVPVCVLSSSSIFLDAIHGNVGFER